jgi:uncharacterized tellurite resistance protein B-like protein
MMLFATAIAIITFFVEKYLRRNEPVHIAAEPPVVTVENVGTYEWLILDDKISQHKVEDLDQDSLKELLICSLLFAWADGIIDKKEGLIFHGILDSHWDDSWGDAEKLKDAVLSELKKFDENSELKNLIYTYTRNLASRLSDEQKERINRLMLVVIFSDSDVDQNESELWRCFIDALNDRSDGTAIEPKSIDNVSAIEHNSLPNTKFRVVFSGETVEGMPKNIVIRKLSNALRMDTEKIEKLFVGGKKIIKKGVDQETGTKIVNVFNKSGAICCLEALSES